MTTQYIILILVGLVIILFLLWRRAVKLVKVVSFAKSSLSTKYGKMTEQFMPFLRHYPYDAQNFRFLGTPIDGVQFNDDEIVFIEFKTAQSQLSTRQRAARDIIGKKHIRFEEIRI